MLTSCRYHFNENCLVVQWSGDNPNSLAGSRLSLSLSSAISFQYHVCHLITQFIINFHFLLLPLHYIFGFYTTSMALCYVYLELIQIFHLSSSTLYLYIGEKGTGL